MIQNEQTMQKLVWPKHQFSSQLSARLCKTKFSWATESTHEAGSSAAVKNSAKKKTTQLQKTNTVDWRANIEFGWHRESSNHQSNKIDNILISSKVEDILQKYKRAHFSNIINIHCTLTASNLLRRSRALQQQSCHQSRWLLHPRLGRPSTCDCNRLHMFKKQTDGTDGW